MVQFWGIGVGYHFHGSVELLWSPCISRLEPHTEEQLPQAEQVPLLGGGGGGGGVAVGGNGDKREHKKPMKIREGALPQRGIYLVHGGGVGSGKRVKGHDIHYPCTVDA